MENDFENKKLLELYNHLHQKGVVKSRKDFAKKN